MALASNGFGAPFDVEIKLYRAKSPRLYACSWPHRQLLDIATPDTDAGIRAPSVRSDHEAKFDGGGNKRAVACVAAAPGKPRPILDGMFQKIGRERRFF